MSGMPSFSGFQPDVSSINLADLVRRVDKQEKNGDGKKSTVTKRGSSKVIKRKADSGDNGKATFVSLNGSQTNLHKPSSKRTQVYVPEFLCKCQILEELQDRFATKFKTIKLEKPVKQGYVNHKRAVYQKLQRYEALAQSLRRLIHSGEVTIECTDGRIKAQEFMLSMRTSLKTSVDKTISLPYNVWDIECYLRYIYSADICWSESQVDCLMDLATEYGPSDLVLTLRNQEIDGFQEENGGYPGKKVESKDAATDCNDLEEFEDEPSDIFNENINNFEEENGELSFLEKSLFFEAEEFDVNSGDQKGNQSNQEENVQNSVDDDENKENTIDDDVTSDSFIKERYYDANDYHIEQRELTIDMNNHQEEEDTLDSVVNTEKNVISIDEEEIVVDEERQIPQTQEEYNDPFFEDFFPDHYYQEEEVNVVQNDEIVIDDENQNLYDDENPEMEVDCISKQVNDLNETVIVMNDSLNNSLGLGNMEIPPREPTPPPKKKPKKRSTNKINPPPQPSTSKKPATPRTSRPQLFITPETRRTAEMDVDLLFSMKIRKKTNVTPLPNFASMRDEELMDHLSIYGVRPLGRKKAIQMLTEFYDETHPTYCPDTPKKSDVYKKLLQKDLDQQQKLANKKPKKVKVKENIGIEATTTTTASSTLVTSAENQTQRNGRSGKSVAEVKQIFMTWLKLPQNLKLYNTLLTLNTVLFDDLMEYFGPIMQKEKISKAAFLTALDQLHITYSERKPTGFHY